VGEQDQVNSRDLHQSSMTARPTLISLLEPHHWDRFPQAARRQLELEAEAFARRKACFVLKL
jgi:hypothetical protein